MWNDPPGRVDVLVLISAPLLQAGVCATLREAGRFTVLTGEQAEGVACAQVVVTDSTVWPPEERGGGEAKVPNRARVLTICPQAREHSIEQALRSGVHGFVRASCSAKELVDAIGTLAMGALYVCSEVAQRMAATFARDTLTGREHEVLRLLARGHCNKSIARDLGIALGTVKTHVKGIMAKLDASSRTEAACIAAEKGLVDVPEFRARRVAWSPEALSTSHERAAAVQTEAFAA